MKVKSVEASGTKWRTRASGAVKDYKDGVASPRRPWQSATLAAAENQATAVQEAIADKRFEKGVSATSDSDWQTKAAGKGARNYPTGIAEGEADFKKGVSPFFSALSSKELSPRGPRGSPQNYTRSQEVGDLLHNVRIGK